MCRESEIRADFAPGFRAETGARPEGQRPAGFFSSDSARAMGILSMAFTTSRPSQGSGFLLGGGKRLLLTLEFGPMAFSLPGEDRFCLLLKSRSQARDQVLQGLTHGHRT